MATDRIKLSGGYANDIFLENGIVYKIFKDTTLSAASANTRLNRERLALLRFAPTGIAPAFLGMAQDDELLMEFVQGESFDKKAERGEVDIFGSAGRLLKSIHAPVASDPHVIKQTFDHHTQRVLHIAQGNELFSGFDFKQVDFPINWNLIYTQRPTRIHGDFWLGNIKETPNGEVKAIDWEYSRIGTPYQDFVSVYLFTILKYGHADEFWKGYGSTPHKETLDQFVRQQCFRYMATCGPEKFAAEKNDGFYHSMWNIFKELS